MTALLAVEDLTRVYQVGGEEVRALDGVTFEVRRGEYVAVIGQSGSGQVDADEHPRAASTPPPPAATPSRGADVAGLSDDALADLRNREIGFVFQTFQLLAARDGARQRGAAARLPRPAAAGAARARARRRWRRSAWRRACTTGRTSCPAGSGSASPSPGRWWASRRSCSPTSPPGTSTPPPARRSCGSSPSCTTAGTPSCSSPTSRGWPPAARAPSGCRTGASSPTGRDARWRARLAGPPTRGGPAGGRPVAAARPGARLTRGLTRAAAELAEALRIALGTLVTHRLRTALTTLGIVIGVTTVIAIVAIVQGLDASFESSLQSFGSPRCTWRGTSGPALRRLVEVPQPPAGRSRRAPRHRARVAARDGGRADGALRVDLRRAPRGAQQRQRDQPAVPRHEHRNPAGGPLPGGGRRRAGAAGGGGGHGRVRPPLPRDGAGGGAGPAHPGRGTALHRGRRPGPPRPVPRHRHGQ